MASMTEMERIKMILSDPEKATMTVEQFIGEEIKQFKASDSYNNMVEAERYYRNRSSVQSKRNDVAGRSNTKIEHPLLKKMVDQKANYLLAKDWTVDTIDSTYADRLNELFDPVFRRKIKSLGKGAVKSGIAWIQPYFDGNKLAFMRIPSLEVIPQWGDEEHTKLEAFIRFYDQVVYTGMVRSTVTHAELWDKQGVRRFYTTPEGGNVFFPNKEYGTEENDWTEPHFVVKDKPYNWDEVPIAWLKYNEEELPLCYFIKDLIDDVNWQTSITADVLRDVVNFIYILKNYGGQDLAEFIGDLKSHKAIKVTTDGGVDKLQADLNIDAVMAFLDKQRRDIFDFGAGVDTKDPELGNASGIAIHFRYMDLDTESDALALELQDTFDRLKLFIDGYFQLTGKGDFTGVDFDIVFNKDMPVNESEVLQNLSMLANGRQLASRRTLISQIPFVKDVEEEIQLIDEEKEKALSAYGEELFDPILEAAPDPTKAKGGDIGEE